MNGILRLGERELMYQRKQFFETQRLNGVEVFLYSISSVERPNSDIYDLYGDIQEENDAHDVRIKTYVTFETNPTIKTLKSLGWYIDKDTMPILAYIPVFYVDNNNIEINLTPRLDDRIDLPSNTTLYGDVVQDYDSFLIRKLVGQGYPDVVYYVANVVPFRRDAE